MANGSVSLPRSSNRTCGFAASGFPTEFMSGSRPARPVCRGLDAARRASRRFRSRNSPRAAPAALGAPVEEAPDAIADVSIDAPVGRVQGSVAEVRRPPAKKAGPAGRAHCHCYDETMHCHCYRPPCPRRSSSSTSCKRTSEPRALSRGDAAEAARSQGSELGLMTIRKVAARPSFGGDELRRHTADEACRPLNCTCSKSLGRAMQLPGAIPRWPPRSARDGLGKAPSLIRATCPRQGPGSPLSRG